MSNITSEQIKPAFDRDTAIDFLRAFQQRVKRKGRIVLYRGDKTSSDYFPYMDIPADASEADLQEAIDHIEQTNLIERLNVACAPNPMKSATRSQSNTLALTANWLDVDAEKAGHTIEDVMAIVEVQPIQPSLAVMSGGGV